MVNHLFEKDTNDGGLRWGRPLSQSAELHDLLRGGGEDVLRKCIHCGFCLPACPTYAELGTEADSPRGRIYLVKNLAEGRVLWSNRIAEHLDRCLGCIACETACPSGVHYGILFDKARSLLQERKPWSLLERIFRRMLAGLLPYPGRLEIALLPLRILQRLRLDVVLASDFFRPLAPQRILSMLELAPRLPRFGARHALGEFVPAQGEKHYRVAFLTGCVMSAMFPETNEATVRVLARNGCEVIIPPGQACCGALHLHLGYEAEARRLAKKNLYAFPVCDVDAIVTNAAGCGAMMKSYAELFAGDPDLRRRAEIFSAKTRDVTEFLASTGLKDEMGELRMVATYDDACHLCHAQQVRAAPRQLLQAIPGLELVPLDESEMCCGSAGPYNLVQQELAERLQRRKVSNIIKTGAELVVTANPGCLLQIQAGMRKAGTRTRVIHIMDLLDLAYRLKNTAATQ